MPDTSSLHILHVLDSLAPGGLENGVVNVARRLHGDGFEIGAACLRFRGEFAARMPDPDLVAVMGKGEGFSWAAVRALRRHLRESRADLVHTHNLGTLIYAALATWGGRTHPIVHGEHGQLQSPDLTWKRLLQRRWLFPLCRSVHTVSGGLREHLRELGLDPRRRIVVTPNGVDCERFRPVDDSGAAKAALGLPPEALVVGIVGRLVALKRHELLFEALDRLAGSVPRLHLLVVGDGGADREALIRAMETHPQAGRLLWTGHRDDLERCYAAMDLLAAPSEVEGLSNAVLEAMACGVPVLAHRACGNAEVIRDGEDGFLAEIRDGASLAGKLGDLLGSPDRLRRTGEVARLAVQERFSMEAMVESYRLLYAGWSARGRP
jgi:glycosyltransferase involved in cell wall biosynthesis